MSTKNIVFIDSRVADYESLVYQLGANSEWFLLADSQDGIEQMQSILANYSGLDSIHVISHGSAGTLYLGSTVLNNANLPAYKKQLQSIGSSLTDTGDILLYGCNVAQGETGNFFINSLTQITGADVAASSDLTGNPAQAGNWSLESVVGHIEMNRPMFQTDEFSETLLANTAPTFRIGDGKVTTDIGTSSEDLAYSVTVQADRKILVAGATDNGTDFDFALVRYNADGTLDNSFSGDGKVTTEIGTSSYDYGRSVTVQGDGKIIVAGFSLEEMAYKFALVRYNADGTLDTSFSDDGKLTTAVGLFYDEGWSVTVQNDGKILVAGGTLNSDSHLDFALVRYNSDGTLDNSFSTDGIESTSISWTNATAYSIAVQADGKIIVAGNANNDSFALARYNTDGTLDTSFASDGALYIDLGSSVGIGCRVTLQDDGKILVSGFSDNGRDYETALARFNEDGTLDESFSNDDPLTKVSASFSAGDRSVTIQADGKILVAGSTLWPDENYSLVRYNPDGSLDTSFGSLKGLLNGSSTFNKGGQAVVLDSDVQVSDAELNATNYGGASITLARSGGANNQDVFSGTENIGALTQGSSLVVSGTTIGTVTQNSAGTLILTFNNSATQSLVNATLQGITYRNTSEAPPSSVQIGWTFSDGNTGLQGSGDAMSATGSSTVNITTFNNAPTFPLWGKKLITDIGISSYDNGTSVTVQADGKILVAGSSNNYFALVRYNLDGSLDTSFADNGKAVTDIGALSYDEGRSVTVQADGKILVAGSSNNYFALVRYNLDGSLDTSFADNGKAVTDIASGDGTSVTVQADGKILVAGSGSSYNDFALVRYNLDGSLDTSFADNGKAVTDIASDDGTSVTVQADGKILVAGYSNNDFALVRYNLDGSLDTSFADNGKAVTDIGISSYDYGFSVTVQADGKILVAGSSYVIQSSFMNAGISQLAVLRFNADGTLDNSFSYDGKETTSYGVTSTGSSIAVQTDGKLLVAGSSTDTYYVGNGAYNIDFALIRYNSDGSLDTTFGFEMLDGTPLNTQEGSFNSVLDSYAQVSDTDLPSSTVKRASHCFI